MTEDAIKKAVGYGFDATLRKGTTAGFNAMLGSSEYLSLNAKDRAAAEKMFERRIDTDKNL
jgi:hypothetical protein